MKKTVGIALILALVLSLLFVPLASIAENDRAIIIQRKKEIEKSMGSLDDIQLYVYNGNPSSLSKNASLEEQFLADFIKALESRWKLSTSKPSGLTDEQTEKIFLKYIQVELDSLQKYENITLTDPWLNLLAHSYIYAVRNQGLAVNKYYYTDEEKFKEFWNDKGYNIRALVTYLITQYYQVAVNNKYHDTMSDVLLDGYLLSLGDTVTELMSFVNEQSTAVKATDENVPVAKEDPFEIAFSSANERYGYISVKLILKNKTNAVIHTATLNVCFTDKDGNIIDSTYPQQPERIRPDKSITFEALIEKEMNPYSVYVDKVTYYDANNKYREVYLNNSEEFQLSAYLSSTPTPTVKPTSTPTGKPASTPATKQTSSPKESGYNYTFDEFYRLYKKGLEGTLTSAEAALLERYAQHLDELH